MKSKARLIAFGGQKLTPCGKAVLACRYKNKYHAIEFCVVNQNVPNVVGLPTSMDLNLIQCVMELTQDIMSEYEDIFNGLGCITDVVHHIETDPNVKPKIHPPRHVPVAKIKVELDRMEKQGIIQNVNGPSEWVNSLVTIVKPNKVRLCIDPKDLNKAIKIFAALDCSNGFYQIKLDEESAKLCTFNTPFGSYQDDNDTTEILIRG